LGEIVNLKRARKQKARDAQAATADANRALHGRTKAEREAEEARRAAAERALDGHRRDDQ
jgi:hypothetical protein